MTGSLACWFEEVPTPRQQTSHVVLHTSSHATCQVYNPQRPWAQLEVVPERVAALVVKIALHDLCRLHALHPNVQVRLRCHHVTYSRCHHVTGVRCVYVGQFVGIEVGM